MPNRSTETTIQAEELRLSRIASQESAAECLRLRAALMDVRRAITNENGLNAASVVDTVWVSPIETAMDRIDAVLCNA